MSLFSRIRNNFRAVINSPSVEDASKKIDILIDPSMTPAEVEKAVMKQSGQSKLEIRRTDSDMVYAMMYTGLRSWYMNNAEKIPSYDDPSRDIYISELWQKEPILAGAVYSMTAKMSALRWAVTGRRLKARNFARILAEAGHFDGYSWDGFVSSTANDFYTTNRGVFWETPRIGDSRFGKLAEIGHIDSLCCTLTGNRDQPMLYGSELTGQIIRFKVGEYIHFASMPSPRERRLGAGFCAVDRAFRAVKLLMALHDYDEEKLNNLPPEGVAAVSGLTVDEFMNALKIWKTQREADNSLTFPQVLWLLGSQPGATVSVDIQGFSNLPESFDREQVVSHYISTLALDFGVDAREFWPISSGALGTSSESEIQHLKAKGKGPGEFISVTERHLNSEVDEETQFGFDTADIEEDNNAAINAKAWVDAYYPLFTGMPAGKSKASPAGKPNTVATPDQQEVPKDSAANEARGAYGPMGVQGQSGPEQVITKDQILRLLADKGVLPEWMMNDERMRIDDTSIHISKELDDNEFTSFVFEKGVLKEHRLPPIILESSRKSDNGNIPYAEALIDTNKNVHDALSLNYKSQRDAPNYQFAPGTHKCSNCNHFRRYPAWCKLYKFKADEDYVCDSWEAMYGYDYKEEDAAALTYLKQLENEVLDKERNIKGDPIPEKEVTRGARVTRNTLRDELERWRKHPILSKYVPTIEEVEEKINALRQ